MNEIEKLEDANKAIWLEISKLSNQAVDNVDRIADLKKEQEVKPVFPEAGCGDFDWIIIERGETAFNLGMTAKDDDGITKIANQMKARKHIIEAINVANKGDNGFHTNNENWFIVIDHTNPSLITPRKSAWLTPRKSAWLQSFEPGFYMRERPNADFIADLTPYYKTVFGIE